MKVTRSSHVGRALPGSTPAVAGAKGKAFAAKLGQAGRAAASAGAERAPRAEPARGVADISAALKAGKITAEAAIEKVVERVLEQQLGGRGSVALRSQVAAALRDALADDPLLAAKLRALSQE